jgi:hypothetical protein
LRSREKEEAIELASKSFNDAGLQRLREMEKQLNWVARAWGNVKDAVNDAWEGIKDKVAGALGIRRLMSRLPRWKNLLQTVVTLRVKSSYLFVSLTVMSWHVRSSNAMRHLRPPKQKGSVNRPMLTPFLLLRNCVTSGKATAPKWRKQRMR